ncbi:hypothetical protein PLICRDRAFT_46952 [Plicaturopsis crispa FD-325 SS-3]|uniref:NADP-dependent oxidoreductase domain-containing protein n=1 Tax=Plicaturopsis crispa FD-325 SS-3 TaxID=944288 RepID=A0A0C9T6R6_PLICR|nr:hypothetical protein PLICRDRAFT_46952 [Plicaturopsis crispa FD-325 SS-3]
MSIAAVQSALPSGLASTVKLGTSGVAIPILGFGVFENDDCTPACTTALQLGYRHIDTARYYENEAGVGKAVRDSGIPRESVFITSKIYHPDFGYDSAREAVQDSFDNLACGPFDLYLIHSPLSGRDKRLETYRALLDARKDGLVRAVGVSNYGVKHLEEIKAAGYEMPAVNQVELHPFCQQRPIVEYCNANGIVVEAYSPLAQGKKMDDPVLAEVARETGKTIAQVLIRWSLQHGFIPLPKSATPARIAQNADIFDFALDGPQMAKLDALDRGKEGSVTWNPVDAE